MKPKLRPCPFCGAMDNGKGAESNNITVGHDRENAPEHQFFVVCFPCLVEGPSRPTENEAIAAWNRRVK